MPDILIHAHVYYPELWDELADCIGNIAADFDLYVTYRWHEYGFKPKNYKPIRRR